MESKNQNSYNEEGFSRQNLDLFVPRVKRHEIARHDCSPETCLLLERTS